MPKICFKNLTVEQFSELAKNKNPEFRDFRYLALDFSTKKASIIYECSKHGEIKQSASVHLNGCGCPKCGRDRIRDSHVHTYETFVKKCHLRFNNQFEYSPDDEVNFCATKSIIHLKCLKCQTQKSMVARNHLFSKKGSCTVCQYKNNAERSTYSVQEIQTAANVNFPDNNFSIKPDSFKSGSDPCIVICNKHGEYLCNKAANFILGHGGCPKCKKATNLERFFSKILDYNNIEYLKNDRTKIKPNELDFFIPSLNLAIEACGLYWHSSAVVENNYHLVKHNLCKSQGIRLFQFFEDEILNSPDIVSSIVLNSLGKSKRIHARKCKIKILSDKEKSDFLSINHIQGSCSNSVSIGLEYNNTLVACMTFGAGRVALGQKVKTNVWELVRYCNLINHTVVGGASKLLRFFEDNYKPKQIFTFCNLRYGTGQLYENLGFSYTNQTKPNYYYYKSGQGQKRYNRFKFRKSELPKFLTHFNPELSEKVNMENAGFLRVYDCGHLKFIKNYE